MDEDLDVDVYEYEVMMVATMIMAGIELENVVDEAVDDDDENGESRTRNVVDEAFDDDDESGESRTRKRSRRRLGRCLRRFENIVDEDSGVDVYDIRKW